MNDDTQTTWNAPFPVIGPLVARHAADAAFYWSQFDGSTSSMQLTLAGLDRFGHLLAAHLEGVAVAGRTGTHHALSELERWRKPGEAFVHAWITLRSGLFESERAASREAVLATIGQQPDTLLRGVIAALGWLPREMAVRHIDAWSAMTDSPLAMVVALRGAAACGPEAMKVLAIPLRASFGSPSAFVRASACRAAACAAWASVAGSLHAALSDADLCVRAEAAIALARHGHALAGQLVPLETLWHCVVEQAAIAGKATGWYRKQALRRLDRWVRHLAGLAPIGRADIGLLFEQLPVRMAMSFIAWHGDIGYLPHLVEQMGGDEARHAGWAWRLLTGVDLVAAGLALPEPERRDDDSPHPWTPAGPDADAGLPLPDAAAVGAWPGMPALAGRRCLWGRPLDVPGALDLLDTGMQAVRSIAAQFLTHAVPGSDIAVRGPVHTQRMRCEALRESVAA